MARRALTWIKQRSELTSSPSVDASFAGRSGATPGQPPTERDRRVGVATRQDAEPTVAARPDGGGQAGGADGAAPPDETAAYLKTRGFDLA
jgi:hypothetical protein